MQPKRNAQKLIIVKQNNNDLLRSPFIHKVFHFLKSSSIAITSYGIYTQVRITKLETYFKKAAYVI